MSEILLVPGDEIQAIALDAGRLLRQLGRLFAVPAGLSDRLAEEVTEAVRRDLCAGLDRVRFHAGGEG